MIFGGIHMTDDIHVQSETNGSQDAMKLKSGFL
jgi:hypothetical protein